MNLEKIEKSPQTELEAEKENEKSIKNPEEGEENDEQAAEEI